MFFFSVRLFVCVCSPFFFSSSAFFFLRARQGEAEARVVKARAESQALTLVAEALRETSGDDAAQLQIAKQYIDMYGEMGKSSNTMLFSDRPADVNALIAQVRKEGGRGWGGVFLFLLSFGGRTTRVMDFLFPVFVLSVI